jgi:hypothetical protein
MVVLFGAASSGSAVTTAGGRLAAATPLPIAQWEFPDALVARSDRVEVGYGSSLGAYLATPSAIGTLFVRNDRERWYTPVPLKLRKPGRLEVVDTLLKLRAFVPDRLLRGRKLFYYAVFRNRRTGRSATVPAAGARAPETTLIINNAYHIQLGAHVFGHPQTPEAVVARAGPTQVGWDPSPGSGPSSFDVAADRSVWLLDGFNKRVLVWAAGHPDVVARTLPLPFYPFDFAPGPAGSLYLTRGLPGVEELHLARVSPSGKLLWERAIGANLASALLRTDPDGTLWWTWSACPAPPSECWTPVATPAGRPLSRAAQKRRALERQPLPGGLQLARAYAGWAPVAPGDIFPHEARFALVNRAGRVVRAWRIRSRTSIFFPLSATAGLIGGDPVIVLQPTVITPPTVPGGDAVRKSEYVALRLGPAGGIRARVTLAAADPPLSYWGSFVMTDLRVGPGSKLYQLGSSPATGVTINQFSLRRTR